MKRFKNGSRDVGDSIPLMRGARKPGFSPGSAVGAVVKAPQPAVGIASDDSELLRSYARAGDEQAFSKLVERYQGMVLGTAFRRTGSADLAQDVTQEIFAALARKAHVLAGRASLGGWLHQAAMYESAHVLKSEMRRGAREERFAKEWEEATVPVRRTSIPEPLSVLDEALDDLAAKDRDALVLRYFQDLSYPEMGAALGVNEATARQRVSRAVERLGGALRARGVTKHPVAVLLGALAIQSTVVVPPALAAAALTLVAAGGGSSAFLLLTSSLACVSSKSVALAIAVLAAAVLWPFVKPTETSAEATSLSSIRSTTRAALQQQDYARRVVSTGAASRPSGDADGRDAMATETAVASVPKGRATIAPRAATTPLKPALRIATAASPKARASSKGPAFSKAPASSGRPPAHTGSGRSSTGALPVITARELGLSGELAAIVERRGLPETVAELRQAEHVPINAARVYGELLQQVLVLDPIQHGRVEELLVTHYQQLGTDGLAGVRPPTMEEADWHRRRGEAADAAGAALEEPLGSSAPITPRVREVFTLVDKVDALEKTIQHPD